MTYLVLESNHLEGEYGTYAEAVVEADDLAARLESQGWHAETVTVAYALRRYEYAEADGPGGEPFGGYGPTLSLPCPEQLAAENGRLREDLGMFRHDSDAYRLGVLDGLRQAMSAASGAEWAADVKEALRRLIEHAARQEEY